MFVWNMYVTDFKCSFIVAVLSRNDFIMYANSSKSEKETMAYCQSCLNKRSK